MFIITIKSLIVKRAKITRPAYVETLVEAEFYAVALMQGLFAFAPIELVYTNDLAYYAYNEAGRIARLTIKPIYPMRGIKK